MLDTALSARQDIADKRLLRSFAYVGGKWVAAENGDSFPVTNPADGATLGDVASLTAEDSARAVDVAQEAFADWSMRLPQERSEVLQRWYGLIVENREDLARIMVLEQGKPLSEARGEIDYAASFVQFYAEEAKRPNIEGVTSHLPDAEVECEVCGGNRYNDETLQIRYRGLSIAEVLSLPVDAAHSLFEAVPALRSRLEALRRVGLGYLELGRRSTTLSSGEAQRIKLARDLARPARTPTLYIFDEPTRGLHLVDVEQLIRILHQLVEDGHTVIAVEHQLDVIRNADFVLDLGPGSGPDGGKVVAAGTPEELRESGSVTGGFI